MAIVVPGGVGVMMMIVCFMCVNTGVLSFTSVTLTWMLVEPEVISLPVVVVFVVVYFHCFNFLLLGFFSNKYRGVVIWIIEFIIFSYALHR